MSAYTQHFKKRFNNKEIFTKALVANVTYYGVLAGAGLAVKSVKKRMADK